MIPLVFLHVKKKQKFRRVGWVQFESVFLSSIGPLYMISIDQIVAQTRRTYPNLHLSPKGNGIHQPRTKKNNLCTYQSLQNVYSHRHYHAYSIRSLMIPPLDGI